MTSSSDSAARRQRRDRGGISVRDLRAATILLFATLALKPVVGAAGLMSACLARFGRRERPTRPCARIHGPCARLPSPGMRIGWIRAALCLGMLLVCVSGTALLTGCGGGHSGVGGLAQTTQLTLVVQ
jgi:hypothetical protein